MDADEVRSRGVEGRGVSTDWEFYGNERPRLISDGSAWDNCMCFH